MSEGRSSRGRSQIRAVPSCPAVSRPRPSGLNETEPTLTRSRCDSDGDTGSPVAASQTRAVPSRLHVATRRLSGLNWTISTWCWWVERRA